MKTLMTIVIAFSVFSASAVMAVDKTTGNAVNSLLGLVTTRSDMIADTSVCRIPLRNSNLPGAFLIPGGRTIYPVVEVLNGTSDDQKTAMGDLLGYLGSSDLSDCNFKVADETLPCPAGAIAFKLVFRKSVGQNDNTQSSTDSHGSGYSNRRWSSNRSDSDSFSITNQTTDVSFAISGNAKLNGFLIMGLPDLLSGDTRNTAHEYHEAWLRVCGSSDRHGSSHFSTSGSRSETSRTSIQHSVDMSTIATLGEGVPRAASALLSIVVDKDNMDGVKSGLIQLPDATTVAPIASASSVSEGYTGDPAYIYTEQVYTAVDAK